jgi:hypothetical protein
MFAKQIFANNMMKFFDHAGSSWCGPRGNYARLLCGRRIHLNILNYKSECTALGHSFIEIVDRCVCFIFIKFNRTLSTLALMECQFYLAIGFQSDRFSTDRILDFEAVFNSRNFVRREMAIGFVRPPPPPAFLKKLPGDYCWVAAVATGGVATPPSLSAAEAKAKAATFP